MAQPIFTKPAGGDPVTSGMSRLKFRLQLVAVSDAGQEQMHEGVVSPNRRNGSSTHESTRYCQYTPARMHFNFKLIGRSLGSHILALQQLLPILA